MSSAAAIRRGDLGVGGEGEPAGRKLLWNVALVLVLACVAARPFLGELPFRTSSVEIIPAVPGQDSKASVTAGTNDLFRTTCAAALLLGFAMWLGASAASGQVVLRHGRLGLIIAAFAVLSALSALNTAAWP